MDTENKSIVYIKENKLRKIHHSCIVKEIKYFIEVHCRNQLSTMVELQGPVQNPFSFSLPKNVADQDVWDFIYSGDYYP